MSRYVDYALKISLGACWVASVVRYWPSDRWRLTALVAYVPPLLILACCLSLIFLLRKTKLWSFLAAMCALLSAFTFLAENSHLLHRKESVAPTRQTVRIFLWNVWGSRRGYLRVASKIAGQRPDIICLSEPKPTRWAPHYPAYADHLNGRWHQWGDWNMLMLSRFPIQPMRFLHHEGLQGLYASIETHPPFKLLFVDVAANSEVFRREVFESLVTRLAEDGDFPDIIVGDMNTPGASFSVQSTLGKQYNDSYDMAGNYLGYTWPTLLPLMRIDLILSKKNHGTVLDHRIGYSALSDHAWQWIEYKLPL